jgi:hypothetical protein
MKLWQEVRDEFLLACSIDRELYARYCATMISSINRAAQDGSYENKWEIERAYHRVLNDAKPNI